MCASRNARTPISARRNDIGNNWRPYFAEPSPAQRPSQAEALLEQAVGGEGQANDGLRPQNRLAFTDRA
jgi:hypothetical protein